MVTYNYAALEVSRECWLEISDKLRHAGYHHTINDVGEIDMHGIAIVSEKEEPSGDRAWCGDCGAELEAVRPGKFQHIGECDKRKP